MVQENKTTTGCDLLENTYLCGSNNNTNKKNIRVARVVICLKIRTFVVATTTHIKIFLDTIRL